MQVFIGNTKENLIKFNNYIETYNYKYLCVDLEFNNLKVALMQLYFVQDNIIWLIDPSDLFLKDNLIKLFTNINIFKIFHGSESLDVPYIYNELLNKNLELIVKFNKKLIDTRFLCEYIKMLDLNITKCSLYDCLLYFDTIDLEQFDYLNQITKKMGKIYYIKWDVKNIEEKPNLIKYAYNDVLYLKDLQQDIYKLIISKYSNYTTSFKYINEIMRFVYSERHLVSNVHVMCKKFTNRFNNNRFVYNKINLSFSELYSKLFQDLIILNINISFILKVGYVSNVMNFVFKYVLYDVLLIKLGLNEFEEILNKEILYESLINNNNNNNSNIKNLCSIIHTYFLNLI
jgi:hypothetical protein